jgi:4-diphosphocytidyl-2-C-methyl-D-erythritol kinase
MIKVIAPAKINLTLEVLKKREDGYHEIRSVVQTISFHDSLRFENSETMAFRCSYPGWQAAGSLVYKAALMLKEKTGIARGALIEIDKQIPLAAGLGGDSSDAAAVIRGLNILWGLNLSLRELIQIAARLGSDVPLFLYGGTVLAEGRGEKLTPLPAARHRSVVLLKPSIPQIEKKTAHIYSLLRSSDYTPGQITEDFIKSLSRGKEEAFPGLFNVFDEIAMQFFKGLKEYRSRFIEAGDREVHVAGSGPTLFALFKNAVEAEKAYQSLKEQGLETYLADF